MATLKKYSLEGQEVGSVQVDEMLATAEANGQMVKDYIVALRANARQWSANTKTRSEVNHSTKKPHPQKGGGRSRQGMLSAPQYKGGGRVFGPRPKFDQHVRINKKERQAAIRFLIGEKIKDEKFHVISDVTMDQPKTKTVANFLKSCNLSGRILFLGESAFIEIEDNTGTKKFNVSSDKHAGLAKSIRNIPKTQFTLASNVSGYDILVAKELVVTESALNELQQWLC